MPIDREAALKKAEKLLRQGKLDGAIEEYVRLIEDQPRDWNAINALGDLYVRAGDAERAVAQFTRVADHLFREGFVPKAAALYKKALKVHSQHEHTLSQLADISARQGVLVDAKGYLRQLAEVRRGRGDERGVAECRARLAALEETTMPAAPVAAPAEAAPAAPLSAPAPPEPPADEAATLLGQAQGELAKGNDAQAFAMLTRVLTIDPDRHQDVVRLAVELARRGRIDSAHGCVDVVADAALLGGDWRRAVEGIEALVAVVRHIPSLIKLVEICVDAGFDAEMRAAQGHLCDAYLDAGSGHEARAIALDLLEADPEDPSHLARLRHALELLGVSAPEPLPPPEPIPADAAASPPVEVDLTAILAAVPRAPDPPQTTKVDAYDRAMAFLQAGHLAEAATALEAATRNPRTRFKAAGELGRLHVRRGDLQQGIEWLERTADESAPTQDEGFAVLYDLADALERTGESARALAIFVDLFADAGEYRDLRTRIDQLGRAQAGAPTARTGRGGVESGSHGR